LLQKIQENQSKRKICKSKKANLLFFREKIVFVQVHFQVALAVKHKIQENLKKLLKERRRNVLEKWHEEE